MTAGKRQEMAEVIRKALRETGYTSLGTLEFLMDERRDLYFLEMNTRVQVEHPVTEMVTGLDLVACQIRAAAGEAMNLPDTSPWSFRGHAIECRINAEDPKTFAPWPGLITEWNAPGGAGVRVDSGVYGGWRVPADYDSLLAKLIVHAPTRPEAIIRMRRALDEFIVVGIRTNINLHKALLADRRSHRGHDDDAHRRTRHRRQGTPRARRCGRRERLNRTRNARKRPPVIVARPLRTCAVFLASAAIGCATSAPSTGYTPPTGIFIPAQTIVAGHGCGTGTDQVYKYAVIVSTTSDAGPAFVTSGVFDCFTDGVFSNLPSPDGGSVAFAVSVLAYNRSSFPDALFCPPNTLPCPGDDAGDVFPWKAAANWTATCTVTEIQGVPLDHDMQRSRAQRADRSGRGRRWRSGSRCNRRRAECR